MFRVLRRSRITGCSSRRPKSERSCETEQPRSLLPLSLALFIGQFGYVVFIAFAPLKDDLATVYQHGLGMNSYDFEYFYGMLYTVYGAPNFFMPLLSGAIIDRIGASKVLMFCSGLNVLGAFLTCVGSLLLRPFIVLSGRLVLGFGNESVYVAAVALVGEFLPIKDITYMTGVIASGSFTANALGSLLAVPAFHAGGTIGLCTLIGVAALMQLCGNIECLRQRSLMTCTARTFRKAPSHEMSPVWEPCHIAAAAEEAGLVRTATPRAIAIFVIVIFCSVANTVCVWNFSMILCPVIEGTWPPLASEPKVAAEERAGAWEFFFMMVAAVGAPVVGGIVSALGCPGLFILYSQCLQCLGHAIFAFASFVPAVVLSHGPLLPLFLISHSNSFCAPLLYTCAVLTLPKRHAGKAFGCMVLIQNVVMGLWPLLVAHLEVSSGSYQSSKVAFASVGFAGLTCCMLMLAMDSPAFGGLNMLLKPTQYCEKLWYLYKRK